MSAGARIASFAALLALVFGVAVAAGRALDPDPRTEDQTDQHTESKHSNGVAAARGDLRLMVDDSRLERGREETFRYRVVDGEERTVRDFEIEQERRMHFIVVRRDLSSFQHLHPKQTGDGAWETELRLDEPGGYRVFADFQRGGRSQTLGADVQVGGNFRARPLPNPESSASTDTGYEVRLARDGNDVSFTVFRDGRRVDDIEPYLGARGHLVALREGDLAYLHVHPESEASEGRDIRFGVEYPSDGRYRLFLQFKHGGRVHTAAFTQEVGLEHGH